MRGGDRARSSSSRRTVSLSPARAARISGVTPAAIISLLRYVKRRDSDGNKAKGKYGRGGEEKADGVLMESAMKSLGGSE